MRFLVFIAAVVLLCSPSYSYPQEIPKTVEEGLDKLKQAIPSVKDIEEKLKGLNIPENVLNDLKNVNLTDIQKPITEAENVLRRKCAKNGGEYEKVKVAATTLFQCTHGLVNVTKLKEEMDKARPTGDLDEVFKKYCDKKPILTKCLNDFSDAVEPCLEPIEKENKKIVQNITEKILSFVCFKEGDRIALFVAAKGPECFQKKAVELGQCANTTFGAYKDQIPFNPSEGLSGLATKLSEVKDLPPFVFDEKSCSNMQTLQGCSVKSLESCDDPTPANLLDSIFNYIKKVTPCEKLLKKD